MQEEIRKTKGLTVYEDSVEDLVIDQSEVDNAPCVTGVYLGECTFVCQILYTYIHTYTHTYIHTYV